MSKIASLQQLFGLKGQRALITGGSSGLGVEFAQGLALAGADVAVVARRKERLEQLAAELQTQGVRTLAIAADLTDDAQLESAVQQVEAAWGGVDILINNAGVGNLGAAEKFSKSKWDTDLAVNLTAVFRMAQRVGQGMIKRGQGGRIINLGSIAGEASNSIYPMAGYSATKSGVAGLTRQLAIEWAPHGITVNTIAPGWFPTEMTVDPRYGDVHPKYKAMMLERIPMGRLGRTGELMGAAIFLASPAGAYITGTVLAVDGGWLAW